MRTLKLASGKEIDCSTGKLVGATDHVPSTKPVFVEVPTASEAVEQITAVRRRISDLPDVPRHMNTVSVVLSYKLFGLENEDIAIATGLSTQQVANVLMSDTYSKMYDAVLDTIRQNDTATVRGLMSAASIRAAKQLLNFTREEGALGLSAVKDVLDRAGHRPADIVEHRHSMDGRLTIEYVKKDHTTSTPMIDITPEIN